jgi:hypothetical protein
MAMVLNYNCAHRQCNPALRELRSAERHIHTERACYFSFPSLAVPVSVEISRKWKFFGFGIPKLSEQTRNSLAAIGSVM